MNALDKRKPQRKNIRLRDYDYTSDGYYFVTVCTFGRKPNLERRSKIVRETLLSLSDRFHGLRIDYHVLAPTHVHIIFTFEAVGASLGQVVRTFKALVTRQCREPGDRTPFWQRNYYEHVIRNRGALSKIRQYIQNHRSVERIDFDRFYE